MAFCPFQFLVETFKEKTAVIETGQVIGYRHFPQFGLGSSQPTAQPVNDEVNNAEHHGNCEKEKVMSKF